MDFDNTRYGFAKENGGENESPSKQSPSKEAYERTLNSNIMGSDSGSRVLAFKQKAPAPEKGHVSELSVLYTAQKSGMTGGSKPRKNFRHIPQNPERILDAPELLDDYYLNLLDWSTNNTLAVALGQAVYLWNASDGSIQELLEVQDPQDYVSSINWTEDGNYLAVGTNDSEVQIWDVERQKQLRSMGGHSARVSSLSWNNFVLSSGSRDTEIHNHDVRIQDHHVSSFTGHTQEVCGLKWSPDGSTLASGGNDNMVCLWNNMHDPTPTFTMAKHQSAVKALAWCPWEDHTLATGGGTADRQICFWNTQNGTCRQAIDTKSQVCSIVWNKYDKELVSSHGFSQNQLTVWKYPTMVKMTELTGHTSRVLHMALSPDGETVCSAAADETLRFWKIFARPEKTAKANPMHSNLMSTINIR